VWGGHCCVGEAGELGRVVFSFRLEKMELYRAIGIRYMTR